MRVILISNTNKASVIKADGVYSIKGIPITVNNSIMNRVLYTEDENAKGMPTMNGKPISMSHPANENGQNVSIFSPEGIDFYSGGKVSSTYNKDGVWYADSEIDEKKLRASEMGEYFANRLDNGEPIGVSTGLTFEANNESGDGYDMIARNMSFDHLAMLHESEKPAGGDATVMRFNGEDIQVVNVEDIEQPVDKSLFDKFVNWLANHGNFAPTVDKSYNNIDLNTNEDCAMRKTIEAKLQAAGIEVNGLDDDALLSAYNELQAKPVEPEVTGNKEEAPQWAADLIAKVNTLETSITANAEKELDSLAEQVDALKLGINTEQAKKLGAEWCKEYLAANSTEYVADYAAPRGRASQVNGAQLLDAEMPE